MVSAIDRFASSPRTSDEMTDPEHMLDPDFDPEQQFEPQAAPAASAPQKKKSSNVPYYAGAGVLALAFAGLMYMKFTGGGAPAPQMAEASMPATASAPMGMPPEPAPVMAAVPATAAAPVMAEPTAAMPSPASIPSDMQAAPQMQGGQQPALAAATPSDQVRVSDAGDQVRLDTLEKGIADNNARIARLEGQISSILASLKTMVAQPNTAAKPVAAAQPAASKEKAVDTPKVASKPKTEEAPVVPKRHAPTKAAASKEPAKNYALYALRSERAWLRDDDGATLSVTVGEAVPGMGVVERIDIDRAAVIMRNGRELVAR